MELLLSGNVHVITVLQECSAEVSANATLELLLASTVLCPQYRYITGTSYGPALCFVVLTLQNYGTCM